MARHAPVDLLFAGNLARHVASGIDPNRLIDRVERWGWEDWYRFWSEEAVLAHLAKATPINRANISCLNS